MSMEALMAITLPVPHVNGGVEGQYPGYMEALRSGIHPIPLFNVAIKDMCPPCPFAQWSYMVSIPSLFTGLMGP